jgi:hypothetical protein
MISGLTSLRKHFPPLLQVRTKVGQYCSNRKILDNGVPCEHHRFKAHVLDGVALLAASLAGTIIGASSFRQRTVHLEKINRTLDVEVRCWRPPQELVFDVHH